MTTELPITPVKADGEEATATVIRHPARALHDDVYACLLPAVSAFAQRKNISLLPQEEGEVLRHAIKNWPRKMMRRLLQGRSDAVEAAQLCIDRSLDVLAIIRLHYVLLAVQGKQAPYHAILSASERYRDEMFGGFANDQQATMQIWPDIDTMIREHQIMAERRGTSPFTLPLTARVLTTIQQGAVRG